MREPTRGECEKRFPRLLVDQSWKLFPVVDRFERRIGFTAIYEVGGRTFATPVFATTGETEAAGEGK